MACVNCWLYIFALSSFKHVIIKKLTFSRRQASKKILPTKDGDDLHITYIKGRRVG